VALGPVEPGGGEHGDAVEQVDGFAPVSALGLPWGDARAPVGQAPVVGGAVPVGDAVVEVEVVPVGVEVFLLLGHRIFSFRRQATSS
jgi:hypothetical protein